MTSYSSKPVEVNLDAAGVYDRISNIGSYESRLNELPEDVRAKLGDVHFTDNSILIGSPMGQITLLVTERIPAKRIALTAQNAPVPMVLSVNMESKSDTVTEVVTSIDVEMPAMLKPLVGPKLQEAADKFGDMVKNITRL